MKKEHSRIELFKIFTSIRLHPVGSHQALLKNSDVFHKTI